MVRFRYLRDPLFLVCLVAYFANRFVLKPYFPNPISQGYVNDLICIPFWVPIMLFLTRRAHLRADDAPPRSYEILIPLVLWSFLFEVYLPRTALMRDLCHADPDDILSYAIGGLAAALVWRGTYGPPRAADDPARKPVLL